MFGKKKRQLTADSSEFQGTTFAKALMQQRAVFAAENEKFRKEMNIPASRKVDETPTMALEEVTVMILGQRFHQLMLSHNGAYFDGAETDTVPASAALAIVLLAMLQIISSLEGEGFPVSSDFFQRAPADTVVGYLRFHSDDFKEKVLRQSFDFCRTLESAAETNPNVEEMLNNIRTLTVASTSGASRIEDQANKVDQAFNSIYKNLLMAIEQKS